MKNRKQRKRERERNDLNGGMNTQLIYGQEEFEKEKYLGRRRRRKKKRTSLCECAFSFFVVTVVSGSCKL